MKQIKQFFTRLRRKPRRQEKRGSSMALVMIITSALVIWVMCLAPLMATTGTTALKVQNGYTDYLASRSAIEYAKSELEYIVRTSSPYTFAVITASDGTYSAVSKKDSEKYLLYVDADDKPTSDRVAAISVATGPSETGGYEILITTYKNRVPGMAFRVQFQETGSLTIMPEAYEQTSALPINDFILVDGKLGRNQVWNSNIEYTQDLKGTVVETLVTDSDSLKEELQPWKVSYTADYASSGKYPALFKGTALAASYTTGNIGEPMGPLEISPQNWVMPMVSDNSKVGSVSMTETDNVPQYYNGTQWVSSGFKVYYNGSSVKPGANDYGTYTITVDFAGTNNGKYDSNSAVNIMPRNGMVLGTISIGNFENKPANAPAKLVLDGQPIFDGNTIKVTLKTQNNQSKDTDNSDIFFGYSSGTSQTIEWKEEVGDREFSLPVGGTYYFYCYRPGYVDSNGDVRTASSVTRFADPIHVYSITDTPTSGKSYYLLDSNGKAMSASFGSSNFGTVNPAAGVFYASSDLLNTDYRWTLKKDDKTEKWSVTTNSTNSSYKGKEIFITQHNSEDNVWPYSYSLNLSNVDKTESLTIADGYISQIFIETKYDKKTESSCLGSTTTWSPTDETRDSKQFLQFGSNKLTTNKEAASHFFFLEVPNIQFGVATESNEKENFFHSVADIGTLPYGSTVDDVIVKVNEMLTSANVTLKSLTTINGGKLPDELNPGTYKLCGIASDELKITPFSVTISQDAGTNSNGTSVTASKGANSLKMQITGSNWYLEDNIYYFGFKVEGTNASKDINDYYWTYTIGENSVEVDVGYDTYAAVVLESGTVDYQGNFDIVNTANYTPVPKFDEDAVEGWDPAKFLFRIEKDGIKWYKLPEGVYPDLVTLVYSSDNENWYTNPTDPTLFYGVLVKGSETYEYPLPSNGANTKVPKENVLGATELNVTNKNDRTASLIRGSALYFMNLNASIDAFNNAIYLETDLLVLNSSITSTGGNDTAKVFVKPYTSGTFPDKTLRRTLLFAANEIRNSTGDLIFEKNCFYWIMPNTDIYNLSSASASKFYEKIGCLDYKDPTRHNMVTVNSLFTEKYHPEINYDLAFANKDQLSRIVSGETVGWTKDGKLLSGNDKYGYTGIFECLNEKLAVSVFVSEYATSGSIDRHANRILLASSNTIDVPIKTEFTTRYLSIDAPTVNQTGDASFVIYNLGQNKSFLNNLLSFFSEFFGYKVNYSSKTLQIDFEQKTVITTDGTKIIDTISPQICRYNNGTNLFAQNSLLSIMTPYTVKEIIELSPQKDSSGIMIVDRYIHLTGDKNHSSIDLSARDKMVIEVYANYIHFADSVSGINITTKKKTGNAGFFITSQEYGYNVTEYMGIFKVSSTEAFSGTLLRFDGNISVMTDEWTKPLTIYKGFYYLPATENGTPISEIAQAIAEAGNNPAQSKYWVTEEELRKYEVIVDNEKSSTYVDTGLWGSGGTGSNSNFYGGTVE